MPQDIDPQVGELPGCTVVGIDAFRTAAQENNVRKRNAVAQAEILVGELLSEYLADEAAREGAELLASLDEETRKSLYALRRQAPRAFTEQVRLLAEEKQ